MEAIRQTFFQECEEQLAELENGLLAIDAGESDGETVNAVFRAVHSIKGGAGAFNLTALVGFAHAFENVLDALRTGKIDASSPLMKTMLKASDLLSDLVRASQDGSVIDGKRSEALIVDLSSFLTSKTTTAAAAAPVVEEPAFEFVPVAIDLSDFGDLFGAPAAAAAAPRQRVAFRPRPDLYAKGNETVLLFRELARLGTPTVTCETDDLPDLDSLDPDGAYLAWTIELDECTDPSGIRDIFDFVEWDSDLVIEEIAADAPVIETAPAASDYGMYGAAPSAPSVASPTPAAVAVPVAKAIEPIVEAPARALPAPEADHESEAHAPSPTEGGGKPAMPKSVTIRVELERVDRLINLAGELVIHQAMLNERAGELGLSRRSAVSNGLDELEQLTRDIQDSVMAIRAQPVRSVFQRLPRLVREVASQTKKQVRLITEGEATEVDKIVVEHLADPLVHMIRNAIDHGIEDVATRIERGKNPEGTLRVAALHRSGRIVIEVSDDGGGINRRRVREIAEEKELITKDARLSDDEIDNLIFLPGFSTATVVSDISGRGVGMDVVRREIQSLGGRISISSRPGEGSTFTLSLPLTLAVLDGMVLEVADQTVVVPLSAVVEILMPQDVQMHGFSEDARVIGFRDGFVPLIDAGCSLAVRSDPIAPKDGIVLLLETDGGERFGLSVDAIQGQRQVVIKSLEANYGKVAGIAAATILGDGRVALILDVEALAAGRGTQRAPSDLPSSASLTASNDDSRAPRELVTFMIGRHEFCIDIMAVREIRGWTPASILPHTPDHVRGAINLRGAVLSIVDFSMLMGLPAQEPTARHVIIVIKLGDKLVGLLVDAVTGILSIEKGAILPPPATGPALNRSLIEGVLSIEERMISLVGAPQLFPATERVAA